MAGAAVIVAVTNALGEREFPFVFGGDGASFAVPAEAADAARQALAETATWVKEDLDLTLRIGMVPIAEIRAHGLDVRVARYAPSENISIAMFSGGGIAWADAAMKHGEIAVAARAARRTSRPVRPVVPLRGNPGVARAGAVAGGGAAPQAQRRSLPRCDRGHRAHRRENPRRVAAGAGPAAPPDLAAAGRRPRSARFAARRRAAVAAENQGAGLDAVCVPGDALQHHRRQLHPGEIHPRADRQFRFPEVRRFAPHGARLHAGAGRRDRAAPRCLRWRRHRAIRHAPPARGDDDVLHAVAEPLQPRSLHRRRDGRLCHRGECDEGRGLELHADRSCFGNWHHAGTRW